MNLDSSIRDICIFSQYKITYIDEKFMRRAYIQLKINKILNNRLVFFLLAPILVFLFFPFPVSVTNVGIDEPLSYIFTFLMQGNCLLGKDIIFPHGPLAFVMYPLPGDYLWWVAIVFLIAVRFAWALSFLFLVQNKSSNYSIAFFLGALLLSGYIALLLTLVQLMILFFLNYFRSKKLIWFVVPLILAAIAFYIKAFVGIVCLSVVVSFFILEIYYIWRKQEVFWKILLFLLVPFVIIGIWFGLYGSFHGLFRFIIGMHQLAIDNSAAAALYPDNLWFWIVTGIISGIILMLSNLKSPKILQLVVLSLPALFAIWKYSMAREDYLHATVLLVFVFFLLLVYNLLVDKFKYIYLFLSALILFSFYFNIKKSYYFEPYLPATYGFPKLLAAAGHYNYFSDTCKNASLKNVEIKKLSPEILHIIGNHTVDIYPWDYSILAANKLNWQPRPVLHSYACYTRKLDGFNVEHFKSSLAPEFLIWELDTEIYDIHGGKMPSIDGRYLLNDAPDLMLAFFSNYQLVALQKGLHPVLLYKKRSTCLKLESKQISAVETQWDTWIDVPEVKTGLLMAQVHTRHNMLGKLKSMLYKDDAVYCYYLLSNGDIRQYRVVPRTMDYGLWVNPLIMNPEKQLEESHVVKMCFRSMNDEMMKQKIFVSFNSINTQLKDSLPGENDFVHKFFGINPAKKRSTLLSSKFEMQSPEKYWVNTSSSYGMQLTSDAGIKVQPESYSPAFSCFIDSISGLQTDSTGIVLSQLWVTASTKVKAALIISIEKNGKSLAWKSADIQPFILNESKQNLITGFLELKNEWIGNQGNEIKIYVWNIGKEVLIVNSFNVKVEGVKSN